MQDGRFQDQETTSLHAPGLKIFIKPYTNKRKFSFNDDNRKKIIGYENIRFFLPIPPPAWGGQPYLKEST